MNQRPVYDRRWFMIDPATGRSLYDPPAPQRWGSIVGQGPTPQPAAPQESFTLSDLGSAVRKITPTLLVVGVATGAAFAIGSGLIHRYVFKGR